MPWWRVGIWAAVKGVTIVDGRQSKKGADLLPTLRGKTEGESE